jgi:tRNA nucleotidyltransferase (CCA-adding enzyme)
MKIYLVGGAVRDALLNRTIKERDYVVIGATIAQMKQQGFTQVGKDFPVFLHPKTKDEHALARTEKKQGSGYTGFICDFNPNITLEEDLIRRDLTVNAIAQDDNGAIIDPYDGIKDLNNKILRHVSCAFSEDPLRVLRVARFAARYQYLGFTIAEETMTLMANMVQSGELNTLTPERVWMEFEKSLSDGNFYTFLKVLDTINAFICVAPSLCKLFSNTPALLKQRLVNTEIDSDILFSQLADFLSQEQVKQLITELKLPNQFKELILLKHNHQADLLKADSLTASEMLELFNKVDIWRRHDRFERLILSMQSNKVFTAKKHDILQQSYKIAAAVTAKQFIAQGIKGPDIGKAIMAEKLHLLEDFLASKLSLVIRL